MHNNSPQDMPILYAATDVRSRNMLEGGKRFVLKSEFEPAGDQPTAIADLFEGIRNDDRHQVLLGATGTAKTFTMAKIIEGTSASGRSSCAHHSVGVAMS